VTHLSFSPDGQRLESAAGEHGQKPAEVITWQRANWSGSVRAEFPKTGKTRCVAQSLTNPSLFIGMHQDGSMHVHDAKRGKVQSKLESPMKKFIWGGFFSPNNQRVVLFMSLDEFWVFDVGTGKKRCQVAKRKSGLHSFVFSPLNNLAAWFEKDGCIHVLGVNTGQEVAKLGKPRKWDTDIPAALAFSPDGQLLASWNVYEKDIHIWDLATGSDRRLPASPPERFFHLPASLAFSPDGKILAAAGMDNDWRLQIWELASGGLRREFDGHRECVRAIAFSPEGRLLASGSRDTTIVIWELYGGTDLRKGQRTDDGLQKQWTHLLERDAHRAGNALATLVNTPGQAIPFLRRQLRPATAAPTDRLTQLIADLGNKKYRVRAKVYQELVDLEEMAEPALKKFVTGSPPLEARRRAENLLRRIDSRPPKLLRGLRALEVLEHIGTPEARKVLQTLAQGEPRARLTVEAKASAQRLAKLLKRRVEK
jgi:hypothetical protein